MAKRFCGTGFSNAIRKFGLAGGLMATALFVMAVTWSGAFAGGYALSGVGSKAIGMGGAFRSLADDWSAAYWNPAGLAQLEESELNFMLVTINPRPEYIPNIYYGGLDVGYRNGNTLYPDNGTIKIPDFSGFYSMKKSPDLTFGVAIFVPAGFNSKWDLYNPLPEMDIRHDYPLWDHEAKLSVIDIHPTLAKSFIDEKLSLGFGLSILRGDIEYIKTVITPSGLPVPHENLLIHSTLKGDGWGFGANFGLLYKFSDALQLGISGKLPATISLSGTAKQELYTMDNEILRDILVAQSSSAEEIALIRALFSSENLIGEPDAEADLQIPGDFGFGLTVKPNDKITITGDMAYTKWSAVDSILIALDGTGPTGAPSDSSSLIFNWEDTWRYSFGAEVWPIEKLAIRLGYYFDPTPAPNSTFTPLIPDVGDKNSYNIGAAFHVGSVELSYNYEYIQFKDRVVEELSDVNEDGAYDNYAGQFKMGLHASHFSITYRF